MRRQDRPPRAVRHDALVDQVDALGILQPGTLPGDPAAALAGLAVGNAPNQPVEGGADRLEYRGGGIERYAADEQDRAVTLRAHSQ